MYIFAQKNSPVGFPDCYLFPSYHEKKANKSFWHVLYLFFSPCPDICKYCGFFCKISPNLSEMIAIFIKKRYT